MKRFPLWLGPATIAALVLVIAAWVFLLAHRAVYPGTAGF